MLQLTREELKELWVRRANATEERYKYLTAEPMRPKEGPPASESQLRAVEARWGIPLPPTYRMFLSLYNGVEKFANEDPLLSTDQILAWDVQEWTPMHEVDRELAKTHFVGDEYSSAFFSFDFRTPQPDGEMEVVIAWDNGATARHANLVAFLESHLGVLLKGIEQEKADREGLT